VRTIDDFPPLLDSFLAMANIATKRRGKRRSVAWKVDAGRWKTDPHSKQGAHSHPKQTLLLREKRVNRVEVSPLVGIACLRKSVRGRFEAGVGTEARGGLEGPGASCKEMKRPNATN